MKVIFLIIIGISCLYATDIVKDTDTGLMWQDSYEAKSIEKDWQDAKSYCSHLSLASYNDWRLPTVKELLSITDIKRDSPAIKIGFNNVVNGDYWSSSAGAHRDLNAWAVRFDNGGMSSFSQSIDTVHVRCVRDNH